MCNIERRDIKRLHIHELQLPKCHSTVKYGRFRASRLLSKLHNPIPPQGKGIPGGKVPLRASGNGLGVHQLHLMLILWPLELLGVIRVRKTEGVGGNCGFRGSERIGECSDTGLPRAATLGPGPASCRLIGSRQVPLTGFPDHSRPPRANGYPAGSASYPSLPYANHVPFVFIIRG